MKKQIIGIIILAILIVGIGTIVVTNSPTGFFGLTNTSEVSIDGLLPLTGSMAVYGETMKNGMDLAIEEINAEGTLHLKANYFDTKADPKEALSALNTSNSCCTTSAGSGVILAEGPVADSKKILVMNLGAKSPNISTAGDYVFSAIPNSNYDEVFFAKYVKNELKISKIAIIQINNDYGVGTAGAFSKYFKELGGEIVGTEKYEPESTDFKTQLIKVKELNPGGLFIIGYKELGILMKQKNELGIDSQLLASDAISSVGIIELAGVSANGLIYHTPIFDLNSTNEPMKSFVTNYSQKFRKAPDLYAANAYDTVMLYAEGIKLFGNNSEKIKNWLYTVENYNGVSGTITFDGNGDIEKPSAIIQIQNQKAVRIK